MNISKACGPNSIPTNLLNEFSESLIGLLKSIINMSLIEGVFPNINKEADVRNSYKKVIGLDVKIINLFHCFQM